MAGWYAAEQSDPGELPGFVGLALDKVQDLRYGENPHQRGALFRDVVGGGILGGAEVLQGKEMSFNNWLDAWAASDLADALPTGACAIVKHNNPCGVATKPSSADSYRAAFAGDPVSAFGGVVAFHGVCDADAAAAMREVFTEVVTAASFSPEALAAFAERPNLRVIQVPSHARRGLDVRTLPGGALVQDLDTVAETRGDWKVVSSREPTAAEWADLELAWTVAWRVKSNTIVLVRDGATVGIGAGQMSRVDSSWIATRKAGDEARGAGPRFGRVLPLPRCARGRRRRRVHRGHPPGRLEGRRGCPPGGRRPQDGGRPDGHPALPALRAAR